MWDKTIWSLIGAILGAIIGKLSDKALNGSIEELLILVSSLLILILLLSFIGPLKLIFSGRSNIHVDGKWDSLWRYKKNGQVVSINEKVVLKQYGKYFTGRAESVRVDGPHPFPNLKYRLSGRISKDMYIEGEWKNEEEGKHYRGFFQGSISQGCTKIEINWLGTETGGVRSGVCLMRKS